MLNINIPKARLLTLRELIGVDDPIELGFDLSSKKYISQSKLSYPNDIAAFSAKLLDELSDDKQDKLNIFKIRGIQCSADLIHSALSGEHRINTQVENKQGKIINDTVDYRIDCGTVRDPYGSVIRIGRFGDICSSGLYDRGSAIRVAFDWIEIKNYCQNIKRTEDGVLEADYGLWLSDDPETNWLKNGILETFHEHNHNFLRPLPLQYTIDSVENLHIPESVGDDNPLTPTIHPAFEFDGIKFVRLDKRNAYGYPGNRYWATLKPIHLWIDEEKNVAVSEEAIVAGIRYQDTKEYLENYFSKDVFAGALYLRQEQNGKTENQSTITDGEDGQNQIVSIPETQSTANNMIQVDGEALPQPARARSPIKVKVVIGNGKKYT